MEIADICKKIEQGSLIEKGFEVKNDLLFNNGKLFLSKLSPFKQQVQQFIHSSAIGGHSRYQKSLHHAKSKLCWSGMKREIKEFIKQCPICQQCKANNLHPARLL